MYINSATKNTKHNAIDVVSKKETKPSFKLDFFILAMLLLLNYVYNDLLQMIL